MAQSQDGVESLLALKPEIKMCECKRQNCGKEGRDLTLSTDLHKTKMMLEEKRKKGRKEGRKKEVTVQ
jgi:hypothetical protein